MEATQNIACIVALLGAAWFAASIIGSLTLGAIIHRADTEEGTNDDTH